MRTCGVDVTGLNRIYRVGDAILLPSRQLIINRQRNPLLKSLACPCRQPDDIPITLQPKTHVEVLGYVALAPELLVIVLIDVGDLLDGAPAENGVVAHEGGDVAVRDRIFDGCVYQVGEECYAVFEVGVDDLHHAGGELHYSDVRLGGLVGLVAWDGGEGSQKGLTDCSISEAASRRQSDGTRVSLSIRTI